MRCSRYICLAYDELKLNVSASPSFLVYLNTYVIGFKNTNVLFLSVKIYKNTVI